jgi:RNA polymerase sigma-70 factor (ECF subfamily)
MPSTEELVRAARLQSVSAFAELVRRYERAAVVTGYSVLGDFHLAQDAAQEAFVAAYQRLGQLRNLASFGPWVLRITRRRALRLLRHQSVNGRERALLYDADQIRHMPYQGNDWMEPYAEVIQQLARLPEHERVVMVMHYVDGRSAREIAEEIGCPVGTITKQLSRAVERLRTWLNGVPS